MGLIVYYYIFSVKNENTFIAKFNLRELLKTLLLLGAVLIFYENYELITI